MKRSYTNRKFTRFLSIVIGVFFFASACTQQNKTSDKISRGIPPLKTVEIFEIGRDRPDLIFNKSGTVESTIGVNISPQISGKIKDLKVQIGQKVKTGQTLLTLDDSLQIDLTDLQYQTNSQSLELAKNSQTLTHELSEGSYITAKLGVKGSAEAYKNALRAKENAEDLFENQQESTDLALETAEEGLKAAKKNYSNLSSSLDDLEEQYRKSSTDSKTLLELQQSIDQLDSQLANAKFARESAENAVEQSGLAQNQSEKNYEIQQEQLDFAINNAYLAYKAAVIQARNTAKSGQLQNSSSDQQILQINNGLKSAKLTLDQTQLKSPIEGTITKINGKENNFVNPGQSLITIENLDTLSIKTGLNQEEVKLLTPSTKISIQTANNNQIPARIIYLSPTPDEKTKKFEIEIMPDGQNLTSEILPGSMVKIIFSTSEINKIFIPLESILLTDDKKMVFTLDEKNVTQLKEVILGEIVGNYVEIISGLKGGEILLKSASLSITEGERVIPNK